MLLGVAVYRELAVVFGISRGTTRDKRTIYGDESSTLSRELEREKMGVVDSGG